MELEKPSSSSRYPLRNPRKRPPDAPLDVLKGMSKRMKFGSRKRKFPGRRRRYYRRKLKRRFKRRYKRAANFVRNVVAEKKRHVLANESMTGYLAHTNRTQPAVARLHAHMTNMQQGAAGNAKIGNSIFARYLTIEIEFNWTDTNFSEQPYRIMISKSKATPNQVTIGDFLDNDFLSADDTNYTTKIRGQGMKYVWDKLVYCPSRRATAAAVNEATDPTSRRILRFKKVVRIMKEIKQNTVDTNLLGGTSGIFIALIKPTDTSMAGTGPDVWITSALSYTDA